MTILSEMLGVGNLQFNSKDIVCRGSIQPSPQVEASSKEGEHPQLLAHA